MTRKAIRDNIKHLNNKRQRLIESKVDLYENRQLSIFKTAEKLINDMTTGTQKEKTRGIKKTEKAIEKFDAKAPLSERMNKTAEKAREGKQIKVLRRIFGKQPLRNVVSKTKELFKNRKNVFH